MRIALLGSAGFIGSNLAHYLAQNTNHELSLFDLESRKLQLRFGNETYHFEHLDVTGDRNAMTRIAHEHDVVINLVSKVLPGDYIRQPLSTAQMTFFDNLAVIEEVLRAGSRLIHFSTCEVYGKANDSDQPFDEDSTDLTVGPINNHRWIYSSAKQFLDRIIHAHGLENGLNYSIVRPFNFVGPLMDELTEDWTPDTNFRVIANFMSALIFDRPMKLVNGGHSRRCFTHIADANTALLAIIEKPKDFHQQVVNIGNPKNELTIRQLAERMGKSYIETCDANARYRLEDVSGEDFYGIGYEDSDRRIPSIEKLRRVGWNPQYDLDQTLRETVGYFYRNRERLLEAAKFRS